MSIAAAGCLCYGAVKIKDGTEVSVRLVGLIIKSGKS